MTDEPFTPDYSALADSSEETDAIIPDVSADDSETFDPTAPTETRAKVFDFISSTNRERKEKKPKEPKPPLPKIRANSHPFEKPLTDLYTAVGSMVMMYDPPCGTAIISNANKCAVALEDLARENDAVRRALTSLIQTSVWGSVIAAHAPIMLAIVMHHSPVVRDSMASAMGRDAADQAEKFANERHGTD